MVGSLVNRLAVALVALASSVRGEVLDVTAEVWMKALTAKRPNSSVHSAPVALCTLHLV